MSGIGLRRGAGVREVLTTVCDLRDATPYLFEVSGEDWLLDHVLGEEVFGPLGLIVRGGMRREDRGNAASAGATDLRPCTWMRPTKSRGRP